MKGYLRAGLQINKDTNFKVSEDVNQQIIIRWCLRMSKLVAAKRQGKKVSFSRKESDKLNRDGVYVPAWSALYVRLNGFQKKRSTLIP